MSAKEYRFPPVSLLNPKHEASLKRNEFRKLVESSDFSEKDIPIIIGTDAEGNPVIDDLANMEHLLVMSANFGIPSFCPGMLLGILYKNRPEDVKLLLIDPKIAELGCFNGIPHLLAPVVCDLHSALGVLDWATTEIEKRCQLFMQHCVNDLGGYNRIKHPNDLNVPHIIIVVSHLQLLYKVTSKAKADTFIDTLVCDGGRAGIHLIITSGYLSPSEFCTETARENIPSRLIFLLKMVDYLKKALIYGHTRRISS